MLSVAPLFCGCRHQELMEGEWVGGRDAGCPGWGGAASIVFACSARMGGWVSPEVGVPPGGQTVLHVCESGKYRGCWTSRGFAPLGPGLPPASPGLSLPHLWYEWVLTHSSYRGGGGRPGIGGRSRARVGHRSRATAPAGSYHKYYRSLANPKLLLCLAC